MLTHRFRPLMATVQLKGYTLGVLVFLISARDYKKADFPSPFESGPGTMAISWVSLRRPQRSTTM